MTFPWLAPRRVGSPAASAARLEAQLRELRDRAALFYRLGYSVETAAARLSASVAWEHDSGSGANQRPAGLSDAAITTVVRETYARRPSGTL